MGNPEFAKYMRKKWHVAAVTGPGIIKNEEEERAPTLSPRDHKTTQGVRQGDPTISKRTKDDTAPSESYILEQKRSDKV